MWIPPYANPNAEHSHDREWDKTVFEVLTDRKYMADTPMLHGTADKKTYAWGVGKGRTVPPSNAKGRAFSFMHTWPKLKDPEYNFWDSPAKEEVVDSEGNVIQARRPAGMKRADESRTPHAPGTWALPVIAQEQPYDITLSTSGDAGSDFTDVKAYTPFEPWEQGEVDETVVKKVVEIMLYKTRTDTNRDSMRDALREYWLNRLDPETTIYLAVAEHTDAHENRQAQGTTTVALAQAQADLRDAEKPMIALNQGPSSEAVQKALENHASQASRGAIVVASATNVIVGNGGSDSANKNSSSQPQQPGNQPGGDGNDQDGQPRMTAAEARRIFAENFSTLSKNAAVYGASLDTYQRFRTMIEDYTPQCFVRTRRGTIGDVDRNYRAPTITRLLYRAIDDVPDVPTEDELYASKKTRVAAGGGPLSPDVVMEVGDPTSREKRFCFLTSDGVRADVFIRPYAVRFQDLNGLMDICVDYMQEFYTELFSQLYDELQRYVSYLNIGNVEARLKDPNDPVYGASKDKARRRADGLVCFDSLNNPLPSRRVSVKTIEGWKNLMPAVSEDDTILEYYDGYKWCPVIGGVPYDWNKTPGMWVPRPYDFETGLWRPIDWEPDEEYLHVGFDAATLSPQTFLSAPRLARSFTFTPIEEEAMDFFAVSINGIKWYPDAPFDADPRALFSDGKFYGTRNPKTYQWNTDSRFGHITTYVAFDNEQGSALDSWLLQEEMKVIEQARAAHRPLYKVRTPETPKSRMDAVESHLLRMWQESEPLSLGARNRELYSRTELIVVVSGASSIVNNIPVRMTRERMKEIGMVFSNDPRVCSRGEGHLRGEPPPAGGDDTMTLYWILPKPIGFYDFVDKDGKATGKRVPLQECFGVWDPLRAEWRLYPERRVVPSRLRTAPIGHGYATYPGEARGEQLGDSPVSFDPIDESQLSYYNGTVLRNMFSAMKKLETHSLTTSVDGWGSVFMGGKSLEGHKLSRQHHVFTMREELSLAPAARVRYFTPLLRHMQRDPGVVARRRSLLDKSQKEVPLSKLNVPFEFHAPLNDGVFGRSSLEITPDVCEEFSAPIAIEYGEFLRDDVDIVPVGEFNATNNVIVYNLDPYGRYYGIPRDVAAERYKTERDADEALVNIRKPPSEAYYSASKSLVRDNWRDAPMQADLNFKATTEQIENEIRRGLSRDVVETRTILRKRKIEIPWWAQPRPYDNDSENMMKALYITDYNGFFAALTKYGLSLPEWAESGPVQEMDIENAGPSSSLQLPPPVLDDDDDDDDD